MSAIFERMEAGVRRELGHWLTGRVAILDKGASALENESTPDPVVL